MDGLFHGKPYEQMDDLGGFPIIFGSTPIYTIWDPKLSTNILKAPRSGTQIISPLGNSTHGLEGKAKSQRLSTTSNIPL